MKNTGAIGENTFRLWCDEVGLIYNKSFDNDKTGWDFYVEFPKQHTPDIEAESAPLPIECKVQVKTTDKSDKKTRITLSNLERLVKAPVPTFVIIFELNNSTSAEHAYLIHIDKNIIYRLLKRIRKIDQREKNKNLSKRTLTLRYDHNHRLKHNGGASLKQSIESHIKNGMKQYSTEKQKLLESVGYEDGYANCEILIENDKLDSLIDVSLGLRNHVELESCEIFNLRFGIQSATPVKGTAIEETTGPVKLEMPKIEPNAIGRLLFMTNEHSAPIIVPAKLYFSGLGLALPINKSAYRIESYFADLRLPISGGRVEAQVKIHKSKMTLAEIMDSLSILKFAREHGSIKIRYEFEGIPNIETELCEISTKATQLPRHIELTENLIFLSNFFNLNSNVKYFFPILHNEFDRVSLLSGALKSQPCNLKLSFILDKNPPSSDEVANVLFTLFTRLGEFIVGGIFRLKGIPEQSEDGRVAVEGSSVITEKTLVFSASTGRDLQVINKVMKAIEASCPDEYFIFIQEY